MARRDRGDSLCRGLDEYASLNMKRNTDQDNKPAYDELLKLKEQIAAGALEANQLNAERVKEAWAEAVLWDQVFKETGLESLPDPEGLGEGAQVLEDWLVEAYSSDLRSPDEVRAALNCVREEIIADRDLE